MRLIDDAPAFLLTLPLIAAPAVESVAVADAVPARTAPRPAGRLLHT